MESFDDDFFIVNGETETVRFTEEGLRTALEAYYMASEAGATVDEIEYALGLDPGTKDDGTEHLQFKILMAMGDLTGAFDKLDEVTEISKRLDEVETEFLYGEDS